MADIKSLLTAAPNPADEEDDYMSMAIPEPSNLKTKETSAQRRIRKQREGELKSRPKSKTELAHAANTAREAALATAMPPTSKGFQMMAKLGFKPGTALGAVTNPNGRLEPLGVAVKEDRGGVGLDSERKRKFREEVAGEEEKVKAEVGGYRERVAREREEGRLEGLFGGAMRVAEMMEEGEDGEAATEERKKQMKKRPTREVNVLWRALVRQREEKERERRARYDLHQSLSRNTNYDDPEMDRHDRMAWGIEEEEVEEGEDEELQAFLILDSKERLGRLVRFLRERWRYCFWCKCAYPDLGLEGCPGVEEEDHD